MDDSIRTALEGHILRFLFLGNCGLSEGTAFKILLWECAESSHHQENAKMMFSEHNEFL